MIYKSRFTMEHTNLFLYENNTALQTDYPNGKVDTPVPGVAYGRADANSGATVLFNQKKTNYTVTLSFKDRSGNTVTANTTVQSPLVLEGVSTKMNINAPEVEGYKAIHPVEKIVVTGDTAHTVLYYVQTSYTVTVHHMYEGSAITEDTEIEIDNVFEEDRVRVTIQPEDIPGYMASSVTITVSGDMEYNLIYERPCTNYTYVDLGLPSGNLWAVANLGANSETEIGNGYAWGDIDIDGSEYCDNYEHYRFRDDDDPDGYSKYNSTDNLTKLENADDVVYQNACDKMWHIPTSDDYHELMDEASSVAGVTRNNVTGLLLSFSNGNSIFFPETWTNMSKGYYWTADLGEPDSPYEFCFCSNECDVSTGDLRYQCFPIRPVYGIGHELASVVPDGGKKAAGESKVLDRRDKPTELMGRKYYLVRLLDKQETGSDEGETKSEEK